jgi:hypothetical protein
MRLVVWLVAGLVILTGFSQPSLADDTLSGTAVGVEYRGFENVKFQVVVSFMVDGKPVVASATRQNGAISGKDLEMIAVVSAAIRTGSSITITGRSFKVSPPDSTYPQPQMIISSIDVMGYHFGSTYFQ